MSGVLDSSLSRWIKFAVLLLFGIPSILCAIYVIYNFIKIPSLRKQFQNQTLIILVFVSLLDVIFNIPITLSFLALGKLWPESNFLCHVWQCLDYIFTACTIWCKAIFTLERNILVFYPSRLRSQRQKIVFHYIPIILSNSYIILFYILTTFINLCDEDVKYNIHLCGAQCIDTVGSLAIINWFFNILIPVLIIISGSLYLLLRVLWTRRKMQRNLRNWSKNWKMIVQLLGMAVAYTLVWLPILIFSFIEIFRGSAPYDFVIHNYIYFLTYLCELSVPILALFFTPEVRRRLRGGMRSSIVNVGSVTINQHSTH